MLIKMCFMVVVAYQMFVRNQRKENKMRRAYGTYRGGQKYVENKTEIIHLEDTGVDGRTILKCTLREQDGRVWTGSIWLSTGRSGGML